MAVLTATQKIRSRVETHLKQEVGQYGPYIPVLFLINGDKQQKIWRKLPLSTAAQLPVGAWVNLIPRTNKSGRPDYDYEVIASPEPEIGMVKSEPQPAAPAQTAPQREPQNQGATFKNKEQIAIYITDMAKLYAFCYGEAKRAMPPETEAAQIQAAASSVFIAAQKRFGL